METRASVRTIGTLCVFCGSSDGNVPAYLEGAAALALAMSRRNINLVYGGGGRGLMGKVAATLKEANGTVTGIIPTRLYDMVKHIEHVEDELIVVSDMHARKATMYERSDAFIALPGGIGTLEEVMEALTWLQLGYHCKPIGLLNTEGFYDSLIDLLRHMVDQGFLRKILFDALVVSADPDDLLEKLCSVDLDLPVKIEHP
jgi:hypothetical protein